jgi:hypothetical protein
MYYYTIKHPGLSHIYSFCLISICLFVLSRKKSIPWQLLIPLMALLVLIRPTNVLAVLAIASYLFFTKGSLNIRPADYKKIIPGTVLGMLIILPQLFYWHYLSGSWIHYSYQEEGFSNLANPQIHKVLFAACNGMFPYAPLLILALWGWIYKPLGRNFTRSVFILFCGLIYLNASWWNWPFGCAFGARAFIEFYPFMAIGLAAFLTYFAEPKPIRWKLTMTLIGLFAFANLMLSYNYPDCFEGGTWGYAEMWRLMSHQ